MLCIVYKPHPQLLIIRLFHIHSPCIYSHRAFTVCSMDVQRDLFSDHYCRFHACTLVTIARESTCTCNRWCTLYRAVWRGLWFCCVFNLEACSMLFLFLLVFFFLFVARGWTAAVFVPNGCSCRVCCAALPQVLAYSIWPWPMEEAGCHGSSRCQPSRSAFQTEPDEVGVAVMENEDQNKGGREGGEGMFVLAEKDAGHCYQCLERGLWIFHIPKWIWLMWSCLH